MAFMHPDTDIMDRGWWDHYTSRQYYEHDPTVSYLLEQAPVSFDLDWTVGPWIKYYFFDDVRRVLSPREEWRRIWAEASHLYDVDDGLVAVMRIAEYRFIYFVVAPRGTTSAMNDMDLAFFRAGVKLLLVRMAEQAHLVGPYPIEWQTLSEDQQNIVRAYFATGLGSSKDIAKRLKMSEQIVDNHFQTIMRQFKVRDRIMLVPFFQENVH